MEFINGENISIVLFFVGVYGLIARRNIVKSIISLGILQVAIILYFISANSEAGIVPPIGDLSSAAAVADPLPQALMITDIVIGMGVTAASLTMFIHMYHRYGSTNWLKVKRKRMK
ncbi:sodium:proton antiporter [Alkalibacter saccharofermentans]|jgi:multicomponent Na+:H+ antiporter subunit C|uniref:Multisubunit sodium/proton antiporter, MrpC subunit (TC 2.A.63.1) n=1 Tax=Alkalibacter saccharofermentans DSM 14828 TaxID=1120975 RepID=A0A1M4YUD2_9FIRM|nr:cation:proton antiporter subunit C [Alkalibacter saccharofermentans]SHF09363.1 multisubunit sodium/proton antiporter, MrpC subunit (TC 2.A.63.1) [Alkalibacter saccharofermentans DSM 14828]